MRVSLANSEVGGLRVPAGGREPDAFSRGASLRPVNDNGDARRAGARASFSLKGENPRCLLGSAVAVSYGSSSRRSCEHFNEDRISVASWSPDKTAPPVLTPAFPNAVYSKRLDSSDSQSVWPLAEKASPGRGPSASSATLLKVAEYSSLPETAAEAAAKAPVGGTRLNCAELSRVQQQGSAETESPKDWLPQPLVTGKPHHSEALGHARCRVSAEGLSETSLASQARNARLVCCVEAKLEALVEEGSVEATRFSSAEPFSLKHAAPVCGGSGVASCLSQSSEEGARLLLPREGFSESALLSSAERDLDGRRCFLFTLCDGHGSALASSFVAQALPLLVAKHFPQTDLCVEAAELQRAAEDAFAELDFLFRRHCLAKGLSADAEEGASGSCVLSALLIGRHLFVLNLGDSRAVLVSLEPHKENEAGRLDDLVLSQQKSETPASRGCFDVSSAERPKPLSVSALQPLRPTKGALLSFTPQAQGTQTLRNRAAVDARSGEGEREKEKVLWWEEQTLPLRRGKHQQQRPSEVSSSVSQQKQQNSSQRGADSQPPLQALLPLPPSGAENSLQKSPASLQGSAVVGGVVVASQKEVPPVQSRSLGGCTALSAASVSLRPVSKEKESKEQRSSWTTAFALQEILSPAGAPSCALRVRWLTRDMRASEPHERKRLAACRASVVEGRLGGVLEPSRAIGDFDVKDALPPGALSAEPEVTALNVEGPSLLLLASDGVWEALDALELAQCLRKVQPVWQHLVLGADCREGAVEAEKTEDKETSKQRLGKEAARETPDPAALCRVSDCLVRRARRLGSEDDATCIAVFLRPLS